MERLNRTSKHGFAFGHQVKTLADLKTQLPAFQHGYNEQRSHNRLAYRTPAAVLANKVAAIPP
ncbi:MAG: integrase core domain-containing protein [Candidatus Competibacter sp.]